MSHFFFTLLPSFFLHMAVIAALANIFWWVLSRFSPNVKYSAIAASVLGIGVSSVFTADAVMKNYQNQVLYKAEQASRQPDAVKAKSPVELKSQFLNTVDVLAGQPEQVTDENRTKLFEQFQALFPKGNADLALYRDEIKKSYKCHMHLYEDTIASIEKKKPVKSSESILCESYSGAFFNREKLISPEVLKNQSDLIAALISGKASDPKNPLPSKEDLQAQAQQIKTRLESVDKIFR